MLQGEQYEHMSMRSLSQNRDENEGKLSIVYGTIPGHLQQLN
jgi:hypothetical protein